MKYVKTQLPQPKFKWPKAAGKAGIIAHNIPSYSNTTGSVFVERFNWMNEDVRAKWGHRLDRFCLWTGTPGLGENCDHPERNRLWWCPDRRVRGSHRSHACQPISRCHRNRSGRYLTRAEEIYWRAWLKLADREILQLASWGMCTDTSTAHLANLCWWTILIHCTGSHIWCGSRQTLPR